MLNLIVFEPNALCMCVCMWPRTKWWLEGKKERKREYPNSIYLRFVYVSVCSFVVWMGWMTGRDCELRIQLNQASLDADKIAVSHHRIVVADIWYSGRASCVHNCDNILYIWHAYEYKTSLKTIIYIDRYSVSCHHFCLFTWSFPAFFAFFSISVVPIFFSIFVSFPFVVVLSQYYYFFFPSCHLLLISFGLRFVSFYALKLVVANFSLRLFIATWGFSSASTFLVVHFTRCVSCSLNPCVRNICSAPMWQSFSRTRRQWR